ncbi:hypothetical protein Skr01_03230 [Sphaerisporangium krabiense]|uniref:Uncharacterized protein n=1 Tax=Sphaerisporangium krabiense TaxID=763782 RepID=A0A7W8Z7M0_9ACTN|nr:hypothetical protein [Sphaerisporangium krabiense]MBB5628921.1 hypothetical protein [Sphaerisporangium krabiense]GII60238.1 hypothetical protein Skr01_03230 [Sphaerisporangium krabiense]
MSDHRHYEFLALDHPLAPDEQAEVRAMSATAEVTATRFADSYDSGDFGGDVPAVLERYYDAHLYTDGAGTREVMLRLPVDAPGLPAVEAYLVDDQVDAWVSSSGDHLIIDLISQDGDTRAVAANGTALVNGTARAGDPGKAAGTVAGGGSSSAVTGVRAELASGDLRPLYLAWLAAVGSWERDEDAFEEDFEDEHEPPVPSGLNRLTEPQRALAEFLRLDPDLLAVAASAETPVDQAPWIAALPASQKDALLLRVLRGEGEKVRQDLLRHRPAGDGAPRRTVGYLLDTAAETRQARERANASN